MKRTITIPIPKRPVELIAGLTLCAVAFAVWPSQASEPAAEAPLALRLESPLLGPGVDETTLLVEVTAPEDLAVGSAPIALALVIDASTSMGGNKLANARKAARETVLSMRDDDRLTLVSFDHEARTLIRDARVGGERARILEAIDGISSSGSTCVACGLEAAWRALGETRAAGTRTAVLIGDGAITAGVSEPAALADMARQASAAGIRTTAIGLGRDYDPVTLQAVADGGDGAFYFAHNSKLLASYAHHELDLARRVALVETVVTVRPSTGLRLRAPRMGGARLEADGTLRLALGRMTPGERRRVLVPAQMMPGATEGRLVGTVAATARRGPWTARTPSVGLARTGDARAALASRDGDVAVERMRQQATERLDTALAGLSRGETVNAKRQLRSIVDDLEVLKRATGSAALDEPLAATRAVLDDIAAYAPGSNALITARRANEGVHFERGRGIEMDLNSANRGGGLFRADDLE